MNRLGPAILVLLLAGVAGAVPITVGSTLDGQRFEWKKRYASRSDGTYGQYEVTLDAGTTYEIYTSNIVAGNTSDPYLYLLDPAGTVLAEDDDSAGALNAKIVFTPAARGTYWIRLRSFTRNRHGSCSLTVREEVPPPPTTDPELRPGDVLNDQVFEWQSAFASRSDGTYGQYRINASAGVVYTFETSNASGGGSDTFLYLLNSSLTIVRTDDDSGAGLHSKLTYQPPADGLYFLRLRAYTRGASGRCTLTVTGSAQTPGNPLFPDLITWANASYLRDAYVSNQSGRKLLRFSNAVANQGTGPLELYGVVNSTSGVTDAYQVVYNDNGSQTTHLVGTFSFAGHETHNHWHFDDFAIYELRDPSTDALVRSSDKVSFCLLDSVRFRPDLPGSPTSGVYSCSNQGISVGWADVYGAALDGQFIEITNVADGTYVLRSTADPLGRLQESNRTNNSAQVTLTITGNEVRVQ